MQDAIFVSEQFTEGHPDKLCDRISDALVDAHLVAEPGCSIQAECAIAGGVMFLALRTDAEGAADAARIARSVVAGAGYRPPVLDPEALTIMTNMIRPRRRKKAADDAVAHHPVTTFGFACTHTPERMPMPHALATKVAMALGTLHGRNDAAWAMPEATVQVAVAFRGGEPHGITGVTVEAAVDPARDPGEAAVARTIRQVVEDALADAPLRPGRATRIAVNPEGPPEGGGPGIHAGLTGRKVSADTYGGFARQGTSALSGKGPGRIDRIAAYAARHAARCIVAAGLAQRCEVQLSYTVGEAAPVSIGVETFGTGAAADARLGKRLADVFDFRPAAIIEAYGLRDLPRLRDGGFYRRLAVYGQMGRADLDCPWEDETLARRLA